MAIIAEYTAVAAQAVAVGENVLFTETAVHPCDCSIRHRTDSGIVSLKRGRYLVAFSTNISVATAATAAALALTIDGEPIGSAEMVATSTAANDLNNVAKSTVLDVPCGSTYNISVENVGTLATNVENANLTIVKLS